MCSILKEKLKAKLVRDREKKFMAERKRKQEDDKPLTQDEEKKLRSKMLTPDEAAELEELMPNVEDGEKNLAGKTEIDNTFDLRQGYMSAPSCV